MERRGRAGDPDGVTIALHAAAKAHPVLSREREMELTRAMVDGDRRARDAVVGAHLRLVLSMTRRLSGYGIPAGDLASQGVVGLLRAADGYEPELGHRFSTYARWWIRAELSEYVMRTWSVVRIATTGTHRNLFFRLRRAKERLGIVHDRDLTPAEARAVADAVGASPADVIAFNRRIGRGGDASLDAPIGDEEDGASRVDALVSPDPTPHEIVAANDRDALHARAVLLALAALPERDRDIVRCRRLVDDPMTLEQLAQRYGVTRERIRQIEARAIGRVTRTLRLFERENRVSLLAA